MEDTSLAGMSRGLHPGKTVHDSAYGRFVEMLSYKPTRKKHLLIKVDRFYPSSQMCHTCGYKNPITKDLSVITVTCPKCGTVYDRDINAAKNIDVEGLRIYHNTCSAKKIFCSYGINKNIHDVGVKRYLKYALG